ncbi:Cof-type HAD-IIB family hydrolase [Tannockella kyphosi]|uniref:Cof-type HAD-IIB family hydrolase n=1 Tax=Tannockella kyphosi TaxID=2899121 RepID=UPI002011025A|nr:Cof-type HAD-IIB family hydrolase [Tannockella kyphosi]
MVESLDHQLLCVDVDGTLARSDKSVSTTNKEALKKVSDLGMIVAIASGRSIVSVQSLLDEMNLDYYAVCLNGALVIAKDKVVSVSSFTKTQVDIACEIIEKHQTSATFNTPYRSIRNYDIPPLWKAQIENGSLKADYIVASNRKEYFELIQQHSSEIVKISILEKDHERFEKIKDDFNQTDLFHVVKSDIDYIDVMIKGCTKGKGVIALADYLNIPLSQVICIGDNENDIEMMACAGKSIAMENAIDEVKVLADHITGHHNQDGVALAIEQFIITKE